MGIRSGITEWLVRFLTEPLGHYEQRGRNDFDRLEQRIRKGDVLLVEGDQRVSAVIKYLTQSSWSHAALYVGDELLRGDAETRERVLEQFGDQAQHMLVEALYHGVVASPLRKYVDFNVRLCRPHRLRSQDLETVLRESVQAIGWRYDVRNILDLAVHQVLLSILTDRYRTRALRLGSGASTEVICTSLLGRLFQRVGFPVLPTVAFPDGEALRIPSRRSVRALLRRDRERYAGVFSRRHPSLLTPRDFDLSPYFEIVKFNVIAERDFDYQRIEWEAEPPEDEVA